MKLKIFVFCLFLTFGSIFFISGVSALSSTAILQVSDQKPVIDDIEVSGYLEKSVIVSVSDPNGVDDILLVSAKILSLPDAVVYAGPFNLTPDSDGVSRFSFNMSVSDPDVIYRVEVSVSDQSNQVTAYKDFGIGSPLSISGAVVAIPDNFKEILIKPYSNMFSSIKRLISWLERTS